MNRWEDVLVVEDGIAGGEGEYGRSWFERRSRPCRRVDGAVDLARRSLQIVPWLWLVLECLLVSLGI